MNDRLTMVWGRVLVLAALVLTAGASTVAAQAGALTSLTVAGLSPVFSPNQTQYTLPKTSACSVNVSATLANPVHRLYIASGETASGATRSVWVCGSTSKISIVIYAGWTEVGRYTITLVDAPPPPPPAPVTYVSALTTANLSPIFSPMTTEYMIPRTSACSVPVSATLTDPTLKLFVGGSQVSSGATTNAWVCNGRTKIDVVVYQVWTEKARYTITLVDAPMPTPTPTPAPTPTSTPTPAPGWEPTPEPSAIPSFANFPLPAAVPVDKFTAERLLSQATFGATHPEMAAVQAKGVERWIAEQLQIPAGGLADGLDNNQVRAHMFLKLANGQDQLRQRMAFALSQTVAVSTNKLVNGYELIPWVRLLENHAFGNYKTILREATLSPSMGKFLDLANSVGTGGNAPNENYPRELLQLFGIGLFKLKMDGSYDMPAGQLVPTYTQDTVREFARALSGWTYPTQPNHQPVSHNPEYFIGLMEPRPARHDAGAKTLLNGTVLPAGQSVTKDLNDVIDNVFNHPNVAPFVATRLIRSLVTSNPSPAYIERVANVFADNGDGVRGDLKAVLIAILTDADAALPGAADGRLRDPILHVIGLARALGIQIANTNQFMYIFATLGQQVLSPTTVFSFYSPLAPLPGDPTKFGPEFQIYSPALAVQRANFIYALLNGGFSSSFNLNLAPFTALAADPAALVEHVNQTLLFGRMSPELRQLLTSLAQATTSLQQRAFGTVFLTAISSEFMVHTGHSYFPN